MGIQTGYALSRMRNLNVVIEPVHALCWMKILSMGIQTGHVFCRMRNLNVVIQQVHVLCRMKTLSMGNEQAMHFAEWGT